jgi:transcriptional regulator with XRE-family HTH domain
MTAEDQPSSLARKLNRLFETIHPAGRGEYSPEEVAKAIADSGEGSISPAYIYLLRKGQRDNPTKRHLELLAGFFGVTPAYFFDEEAAERIEQQLDLLAAFRDGNVRRLAARASGLSPRSLTSILQMVDAARELEGLGEPSQPSGDEEPASGREPEGV